MEKKLLLDIMKNYDDMITKTEVSLKLKADHIRAAYGYVDHLSKQVEFAKQHLKHLQEEYFALTNRMTTFIEGARIQLNDYAQDKLNSITV